MNSLNLLNLILSSIAVLVGIFALVQTYKKNKFEKLITEAQGVFKKSDIKVCFYGFGTTDEKNSSKRIPDRFFIAAKLKPETTLLFPFQIMIINTGDKTAEDVSLYLRYPRDIHNFNDQFKLTPLPKLSDYEGQYFTQGNFQTGVHQRKKVDPHTGTNIVDYLTIRGGSSIDREVEALAADNVPVSVRVRVDYDFVISYTLFQKDLIPLSGKINIHILDTSKTSISKFVADWNERAKKEWDEKAGKGLRKFLYLLKLNWRKKSVSGNKPSQRIKFITHKESAIKDCPEYKTAMIEGNSGDVFIRDGFCDIRDYMIVAGINFAVDETNKENIENK